MNERAIPTTIEALWTTVNDAPSDASRWEALAVLGDAYRDAGDDGRADALAWAVGAQRVPYFNRVVGKLTWWDHSGAPKSAPFTNHVDGPLFERLRKSEKPRYGSGHADYETQADAFRDLIEAFVAAVAAGWQPGEGVTE